jgi:trans-AT polyketide synthase/acyltransferase/oxidoreductase domain-containing protein
MHMAPPHPDTPGIDPATLGSPAFRKDYGVRYAYAAGAMYKGIASTRLVVAMGRAGLLAYLGTGGMSLADMEAAIGDMQGELASGQPYGLNLLCNPERPDIEERTVELFLARGVRCVEAAAFTQMTSALVRYRLAGCRRAPDGDLVVPNRVLAKVSRPEVATAFMSPAPAEILKVLTARRLLSPEEAEIGRRIPMSDDVCVEADSGGHTDQGVALVLLPTMIILRDRLQEKYAYRHQVRVGAAGGIGTPHAAAAVFMMGADFILTGSINQCTPEAGTSDAVKDLLQEMEIHETAYAPAGDMFETGARVQVLRRGLLFPMRASRLYELYQRHESLDDLDATTRARIEEKFFGRTFEEIWRETRAYHLTANPRLVEEAERLPKRKMALVFRWYFTHTSRLALKGDRERKADYQVHCGPALGAFNQWVKGTDLEPWRNRHVVVIAERLMAATAQLVSARMTEWSLGAAQGCERRVLAETVTW